MTAIKPAAGRRDQGVTASTMIGCIGLQVRIVLAGHNPRVINPWYRAFSFSVGRCLLG
jgi:hypothetical protein